LGEGLADFPIVGIGSSAGGLEALEKLFDPMPPDTGAAFVVVAHLDPTRESHLTELLSRRTRMPTVEVKGDTRIDPNHVYVIAPDQALSLDGDVLQPSKPSEPRAQRRPIDVFFRSLAENQKERAIAIVLSGTGSNGSAGLRFIKAEGGIAIAQDPDTASHSGMPQNAIATGIVDLVLPPEQMAAALVEMVRHPYVRQPEPVQHPELDGHLSEMLALLRSETKLDFQPYRRQTLLRRTHRRMGLHQIRTMGEYLQRLRADPQEVNALAKDLTINVSGFFRDPEAWRVLDEKVLAPLAREREANSRIRMWVPGCATGEEAYSLAMLFFARADEARKSFDLRIFATDVAQHILPLARAGMYPASIAAEIGDDRLERFFETEDDTYLAKKLLRESITFAPQNLLQDPPFSRLDLISCRNVLIYLEPEVQRKLLALFHFALREGGHLFLGSAEGASGQESLFQAVSKKWRIYRRIGPTRHDIIDFPLIGAHASAAKSAEQADAAAPLVPRRAVDPFQRALLERFAPASVLIDRHFDAHAFHGATGDYVQQPGGEPTTNLLALARDGLQAPLRTAVQRALAENREVSSAGRVKRGGAFDPVEVTARPLGRGPRADGLLVVSFFERERPEGGAVEVEEASPSSELERELLSAREDLRITIEQMDTANEELKASNEEIRSINEELQASNEELETSKEELQSLNEELNTTNNQLQAKVEELEVRTNDLNNLLNSTDIATLFLDRNLCIRWFTPTMKALLELLPSDIGRPISHFAQRFKGGDLVEDARKVLERLIPSDAEVVDDLGRWYLRHMMPYRTEDDRINGVAVTFTEITERKRWEEELKAAKEFAEEIVDTVPEPLLVLTPELKVRSGNESFYRDFRVSREQTQGRLIYELGNGQWDIPELRRLLEEMLPHNEQFSGYEVEHEFEGIGRRTMLLNARRLDDVQLVLLSIRDITERKLAEERLRASEERLRKVLETEAVGVLFFDETGTLIDANDVFLRMTGYAREDVESRQLTWRTLTPPEWLEVSVEQMEKLATTGHLGPYEQEYFHKDGSRSWMLFAGAGLGDGTSVEYVIDISERKRAERERELLSRELSHRVKNTLAVVQALAMQTNNSGSVKEYRDKFIGRLSALARAHGVLLDAQWRDADLKQLVEQALQAYEPDRAGVIEIQGDPVPLSPTKGLGLSLIMHELATNAAKYGALARREGRVRVSWQVERGNDGRRVRLRWAEQGVPELEPPRKRSFGTRLIERACRHELEGEVELDYAPGGLRCELVFPLG
jgi:two-component system CheB/CheR fusion protein